MNLFVDTNIVVANVFLLNSLHDKSKIVFNKYLNIFWSATVKKEFKKVFTFKLNILTNFYLKLYYYFLNFPVMEFTESKFYSIVKILILIILMNIKKDWKL